MSTTQPKHTKRYTDRNQIIDQIDKFTEKRNALHHRSAELLSDAKALRELAHHKDAADSDKLHKRATKKEEAAEKIGTAVKRLDTRVLPEYRQKLAEFDTEVLPGVTNDKSVQAP